MFWRRGRSNVEGSRRRRARREHPVCNDEFGRQVLLRDTQCSLGLGRFVRSSIGIKECGSFCFEHRFHIRLRSGDCGLGVVGMEEEGRGTWARDIVTVTERRCRVCPTIGIVVPKFSDRTLWSTPRLSVKRTDAESRPLAVMVRSSSRGVNCRGSS